MAENDFRVTMEPVWFCIGLEALACLGFSPLLQSCTDVQCRYSRKRGLEGAVVSALCSGTAFSLYLTFSF